MKKILLLAFVAVLGMAGCAYPVYVAPAEESFAAVAETPSVEAVDFGHQAAEDFLIEFLSLFSLGFQTADGTYMDFHSHTELSARPHVLWKTVDYPQNYYRNMYVGLLDEPLEGKPFVNNGGIANTFALYDLNGDDIPTIVIRWGIPETCAHEFRIFKFYNGAFQDAGRLKGLYSFYFNYEGRLIIIYNNEMTGLQGDYYISFVGGQIQHEPFETTSALTPIYSLAEMHTEITNSINARLDKTSQ